MLDKDAHDNILSLCNRPFSLRETQENSRGRFEKRERLVRAHPDSVDRKNAYLWAVRVYLLARASRHVARNKTQPFVEGDASFGGDKFDWVTKYRGFEIELSG